MDNLIVAKFEISFALAVVSVCTDKYVYCKVCEEDNITTCFRMLSASHAMREKSERVKQANKENGKGETVSNEVAVLVQ